MLGVPDKTYAPISPAQRIADKARDLRSVVHIQLIGGQRRAFPLDRPVHEQDRNAYFTYHLVVTAIEHFDADDGLDLFRPERDRQRSIPQVLFSDAVRVHRIAKL